MLFIKKMNFTKTEIGEITSKLDGYIWVVVDVKRGVLAAGDEFVGVMKERLLKNRSHIRDIFGVGLGLEAGDIDYNSLVNRKLIDRTSTKEVPEDKRGRIEILVRYFFGELPVFKTERMRPRYCRRIGA